MTPDNVRAAAEQLVQFHELFAPLFGTEPAQNHAYDYIKGLMVCPERKSVDPQEGMDLGLLQSLRASSFRDPDRLDGLTGVGFEDLAISGPAAESAQRLEATVDCGGAKSLDGHQVLSVVDQVSRAERFPTEVGSPGFSIPAAKGQEVLAVAIDCLGAQVLGHKAGEEGNQPILPLGLIFGHNFF